MKTLEKMLGVLLFIYAITSLLFSSAEESGIPNLLALITSATYVLYFKANKSVILNKPIISYVLLFLISLLTVALYAYDEVIITSFFLTVIFFFVVCQIIFSTGEFNLPIAGFYVGAIIVLIRNILMRGSLISTELERVSGGFENPNRYGYALTIAYIIGIYFLKISKRPIIKFFIVSSLILIAFETLINIGSKKAILLLILSTIFFFFETLLQLKLRYKIVLFVALLLTINLIFSFVIENSTQFYRIENFFDFLSGEAADESSQERSAMFISGVQMFMERPFFGNGFGAFKSLSGFGTYSHNNYVQLLAELGLLGFLLYYYIFFFIYKGRVYLEDQLIRKLLIVILIVFLFNDLTVVTFYNKFTVLILAIFIGYISRIKRTKYE